MKRKKEKNGDLEENRKKELLDWKLEFTSQVLANECEKEYNESILWLTRYFLNFLICLL